MDTLLTKAFANADFPLPEAPISVIRRKATLLVPLAMAASEARWPLA